MSRRRFWIGLLEALANAGVVAASTEIDRFHLREGPTVGLRRKWGQSAGYRPLARRENHENPCAYGRHRAALPPKSHPRQRRRHHRRAALLSSLTSARHLLGDKGYDANALRRLLNSKGVKPVIDGRANRKQPIDLDRGRYRERHLIENAFCRIKDFRRVATRYDKLAANFLSAVAIAAAVGYWL